MGRERERDRQVMKGLNCIHISTYHAKLTESSLESVLACKVMIAKGLFLGGDVDIYQL